MTEHTSELSFEARNLSWLLNGFVRKVPGIQEAVVLSADGLPMAVSKGLDRDAADRRLRCPASFAMPPGPSCPAFNWR